MIDFSKNYFELFGLSVGYVIDLNTLSSRFRALQGEYHPDKFATASDQERRLSVQSSTLINEAQATLVDDMLRAKYLLSLHDVAFNPDLATVKDVGFLMQQLELRETLENVAQADDPFEKLDEMREHIADDLAMMVEQVEGQFQQASADSFEQIKDNILKMQFLQKFQREANRIEENLEEDY